MEEVIRPPWGGVAASALGTRVCTLTLPWHVLGCVSGEPVAGRREGGLPSHLQGGDRPLPSPAQRPTSLKPGGQTGERDMSPTQLPAEAVQPGCPGQGRGRSAHVPS